MDPKPRKKRFCFVYRTTNLVNQKYYIGCHCTFKLDDGYLGSGMRIQRAVAKYGRESFKLEILQFFETREEALAREKELVTEKLLKDPMCMNIQLGGNGGWSQEQQIKLSKRAHVILAQKLTPERREKFREQMKKRWQTGLIKHQDNWTGKRHKPETIERIKQTKSNQGAGSENSQYGTCWIYRIASKESKKVTRSELSKYLSEGWLLGRRMAW
jgi:group I intron endonuclease